jgi:hypothetical protein
MPLPHIVGQFIHQVLVAAAANQVTKEVGKVVRSNPPRPRPPTAWEGFKEFDRKCDEWVRRNW